MFGIAACLKFKINFLIFLNRFNLLILKIFLFKNKYQLHGNNNKGETRGLDLNELTKFYWFNIFLFKIKLNLNEALNYKRFWITYQIGRIQQSYLIIVLSNIHNGAV